LSLLSALRPQQWVKNTLVFLAMLLGHRFTEISTLLHAGFAFILACLASSAVYLFNDMFDIEADRRHPAKQYRPFVRGSVSIRTGVLVGAVLAVMAVGLGLLLSSQVSLLLALYIASALLYSVWLKKVLVVDMVLLAAFYAARVFIGAAATGIRVSSWTALFCVFIFFGLAALKRYAEVRNLGLGSPVNRRAYRLEDGVPLLAIGSSSFLGAIIALGLYLGSPDVRILYSAPDRLWLLCPILLGWTSRMWILGHRGELRDEDPVAFTLRDRSSLMVAALCAAIFVLAL
jgi:4-hydroxybenzoate polyprenyltransferase